MSKYIDAEKIPWTDLNDCIGGVNVYVTFLEKVARMPAADVVEVVRCKDCKYRGYQYRDFHGTEKVVCWKYGYGIQKNANGYCDDWDFRDEKDGEQNG